MDHILIAECCQNHNGSINILKEMVKKAAQSGATHVKMQTIFSKNLTYRPQFEAGMHDYKGNLIYIKRPYKEEHIRLKSLEMNEKSHEIFIEECQKNNVKAMTTCFAHENIEFIKNLGFSAVKIASYDASSYEMINNCIRNFKDIFISTGATYDEEIKKLGKIINKETPLLHCITSYPNKCEYANIDRINYLKEFSNIVGFSDHTEYLIDKNEASLVAIFLGAKVIERHFTILDSKETKDGKVSIDSKGVAEIDYFFSLSRDNRLEYLQKNYPNWERCIGSKNRTLSENELLNRRYYRGRFATARNIQFNTPPTEWIYNWETYE